MAPTNNAPSFRFPLEVTDPTVHPQIRSNFQSIANALSDIYQSIPQLTNQVNDIKNTTQTIIAPSGGGSVTPPPPPPTPFPGLGGVNDQTGATSYTTTSNDNGSLLIFNDASPVAVTLSSTVTTPYFIFLTNEGVGAVTLTPSSGTINGTASLTLLQNQSAIAFFNGTNWEAMFISFGTVTHATTGLTSGSIVIGNGANDVKIAPMDFGVTTANNFNANAPILINTAGAGGNVTLGVSNASTAGAAWILTATVGSGNAWGAQATGSTALPFRGYLIIDNTAPALNLILTTTASKPVASLTSTGMFAWYAGASPVSTALDTGLSRTAAATVAVGNGTQGDASGALTAANLHATAAASGTINLAPLTVGGTAGTITVVDGIITTFTNPT